MPEHRKKERRKGTSDSEGASFYPDNAMNHADFAAKHSEVVASCSDNYCITVSNKKQRSPSPVVNTFVIDSDEDCATVASGVSESKEVIRLAITTPKSRHGRRRVLPQKGTKERAEVLKEDAKKRAQDAAGRHLCPYCSYCAPFPSKVKRHIANRHSKSHECSRCDSRFDTHSKLREHISSEHPTIHFCEFCNYSNKARAWVRRHTIVQHENGVMCTVAGCNQRVSRWRLKTHLAEEHSTNAARVREPRAVVACAPGAPSSLIKCSQCEFDTNDVEDYNLHVMRAHETGIECPMPECSAHFLLDDMDNHFALVHNKKTFEYSSRSSVLQDDYGSSCTTSTVSEYVSTSNCSDTPCSDIEKSTSPIQCVNYQGAGQGFHCGICKRSYRDLYLLKKHVKSVHERSYGKYSRPLKYACDFSNCGKAFTTPGLLQDHINKHQGVKPYECTNCGCSFYAKARFAVHLSKYHKTSIRDCTKAADLLKRYDLPNDVDSRSET